MKNNNKKISKNKKRQLNKIIYVIILLIILTFLVCWLVRPFYKVESRVRQVKETMEKYKSEKVLGWIKVQGTNIDYPIVYSKNDVATKRYSYAWTEFSSYNIDNRKVLFGHNIMNLSSNPRIGDEDFSGFEDLLSYLYTDFVKKNKYIQYTVGDKDYLYKVFAVSFVETNKGDFYTDRMDKDELDDYIKKVKKDSYFKFDVDVDSSDGIITLVTCTRFFGTLSGYSFRIDARRVRNGELISNYDVKEKTNYNMVKKKLKGDEVNEKA